MKIKINKSILKQVVDSTLQDEGYQALKIFMSMLNPQADIKYKENNTVSVSVNNQKPILVQVLGFDK